MDTITKQCSDGNDTDRISTLDLHLTGGCQYVCKYCWGEEDTSPPMTRAVFDACLDFAERVRAVTIEYCGGEPTLSPHFREFVISARRRGFRLILRTNGLKLPAYLDLVAEHFDWVGVSLDGMPEINSQMRPSRRPMSAEEKFQIPIESIWRLHHVNPRVKIMLASIATSQNFFDLPNLQAYVQDTGLPITKWKVYEFMRDYFRSAQNHQDFAMLPADFAALRRTLQVQHNGDYQLIMQGTDTIGAGSNCLLVYHDGAVRNGGLHFGYIGRDPSADIAARLFAGHGVDFIQGNKSTTYELTYNGKQIV